jgi:hypothetical protein
VVRPPRGRSGGGAGGCGGTVAVGRGEAGVGGGGEAGAQKTTAVSLDNYVERVRFTNLGAISIPNDERFD